MATTHFFFSSSSSSFYLIAIVDQEENCMGNCIRHGQSTSSMKWGGGDDWSSMAWTLEEEGPADIMGGRVCERDCCSGTKMATAAEMVKVRISRRQLEELLGRVDVKEMSVHQAVALLLTAAANGASNHRPWRPALQSIPEGN
ncbi:hypothetical protein SAY86_003910 [Trapa natans]|uniref:Uncharacterized protein n=1 Tax=Trapa natans TaxID=22666 RepID=A0AAN7RPT0_TRANT|nr:hypothetical protein SAY86_003910 [Trapa natans]